MFSGRWSIMEFIFAGRLPRDAVPPEDSAGGGTAEDRLEQTADRLEKQRLAREKEQREKELRVDAARLKQAASGIQESLAAKEAELRGQQGSLQRDLPGGEADAPVGFAEKIHAGIAKTREKLSGGLNKIMGREAMDKAALEDLEELLMTADIGVQTTGRLIKALQARLGRDELREPAMLKDALREEVSAVMGREYHPPNLEAAPPVVILFAGVNGSGKTTTIGKLGAQFRNEGKRVLLVAGDTFRAAAAEQLAGWGGRAGCEVFSKPAGSNPSGVIYEAVEKAVREGFDLVLCDTAGRLHTKTNLMEELKKIKRVIAKVVPAAPHETYLVLDANNGQNAIVQTREFHKAIGVTGLIVTKLDGTARGGVVLGIVNEFELPVRYIGVGEGVDDLRPFDAEAFADSLFD